MDERDFKSDPNGGPDRDGGNRGRGDQGRGDQGRGMPGQSSEPDEELQAILDEVQDKYRLLTFHDPDIGFEMQYELYVPENYDASESYPMIMFIPDSRAAGREAEFSLTVGWGGVIWATAEEQAKHPCFVLIPIFTETDTTVLRTLSTSIPALGKLRPCYVTGGYCSPGTSEQ